MRHYAGADLAFASDSSALVIVSSDVDGYRVSCIEELRPKRGAPLRPKFVVDTFAGLLKARGCGSMYADGHYRESAREHLEPHHITFRDAPGGREGKERVYLNAKKLIHERRVRIPRHARLLAQLRSVVSKEVAGGGVTISSPRRAGGGGHGDLVSALVLALWAAAHQRAPSDVRAPPPNVYAGGRDERPIESNGGGAGLSSFGRVDADGRVHIGGRARIAPPSGAFATIDASGDFVPDTAGTHAITYR